jgi:hypothetical protein
MNEHLDNVPLIRRYLLGETTEDEGERVERLLFTDAVEFENALILEDELADDCAQGLLSENERLSFASNYVVTKERRQRVWFARMLISYGAGISRPLVEHPKRTWHRILRWAPGIHGAPANSFAVASYLLSALMIVLTLSLVHRGLTAVS